MRAIADKDQAGFDKSLLERLQVHKRAHSRGKAAADVAGLIDPLASGMAVLGGARGLTSNVESDYMPQWLLGKLS